MQRYFLSEKAFSDKVISGDDYHHIVHVMRMKPDDKIEVIFAEKAFLAAIIAIDDNGVQFKIVEELITAHDTVRTVLIQGLAKGDKNEEIIKHSTELGVSQIILTKMTYSIAKLDGKVDTKLARYNKISKEAAEQAHRATIPFVSYANNFAEIDFTAFDVVLLLDEEEAKKAHGFSLKTINLNNYQSIAFIIGPEGGISPKERQLLLDKGAIAVSLGRNILRTETASLAFLAMLKYALME